MLEEAEIPVMVMEPVHGGLLANLTEDAGRELKAEATDASQASFAMRWVMSLDVSGFDRMEVTAKEEYWEKVHTLLETGYRVQ